MALTQQQRDERRHAKAAALQEEDLRLKVRLGTKQALAELMKWAGIDEQGEAMTLMIHHLHALGRDFLLRLLAPQNASCENVAPTAVLRLGARPRTAYFLGTLANWADLETGAVMDQVIHAVRALEQHHAVKFLTPPKHKVKLSTRLVLDFDRKSMLMIQQDPGDEVIAPIDLGGSGDASRTSSALSSDFESSRYLLSRDRDQLQSAVQKCRAHLAEARWGHPRPTTE